MIYMEPEALGWEPLLKSWIQRLPNVIDDYLKNYIYESLFIRFCKPLFHLLRRGGVKVYSYFMQGRRDGISDLGDYLGH